MMASMPNFLPSIPFDHRTNRVGLSWRHAYVWPTTRIWKAHTGQDTHTWGLPKQSTGTPKLKYLEVAFALQTLQLTSHKSLRLPSSSHILKAFWLVFMSFHHFSSLQFHLLFSHVSSLQLVPINSHEPTGAIDAAGTNSAPAAPLSPLRQRGGLLRAMFCSLGELNHEHLDPPKRSRISALKSLPPFLVVMNFRA